MDMRIGARKRDHRLERFGGGIRKSFPACQRFFQALPFPSCDRLLDELSAPRIDIRRQSGMGHRATRTTSFIDQPRLRLGLHVTFGSTLGPLTTESAMKYVISDLPVRVLPSFGPCEAVISCHRRLSAPAGAETFREVLRPCRDYPILAHARFLTRAK